MPKDTDCHSEFKSKSSLVSGNITVMGRRTSIRLEPEMWKALREISRRESCTIHDICTLIYVRKNPDTSLTAAIRVFLMLYYRAAATEEGHQRAGHGDLERMKRRARIPVETGTGAQIQVQNYSNGAVVFPQGSVSHQNQHAG